MVRPTGVVTFLFSDIEGSTARWDAGREAMTAALARHDALVRGALETHRGYIFKTMGDSFCAAFATPADAIAAALDAQRALAAEDFTAIGGLPVRMALHTGTADERDGDYFGPTVNRVARLLAIGHGGQVLVSGTAAELLHGEMPGQSSLRDLGEHRLRDLARGERVYQLIAPDLPSSFAALRSLEHLSNNLPAQLTSFVGRDAVVAEIETLVDTHRLVTLTGAGGAGKTRCATHVGAELLDGSGDGVWLAELAPISDPAQVAHAVAQGLNIQEQPNRPALETLLAYLKHKRLLLILDNCEHVVGEARSLAAEILRHCPGVRILATSRESLNISGEATYRMPSLTVPAHTNVLTTEGLSRYGAVQLFVDRALLSNDRFAFTQENAPHVAEVCRRLDGIPLAIELAAARVKVLSPKQLAQKLDERFRVLTAGDRSALPRQQTMRALIDWSYDLLSGDERAVFGRLSIFAGTFTLEAATAVCSPSDDLAALDQVSSLVDKSLVQAEPLEDRTRYRLLESTRQYAREKLIDTGEYDATAQAHARAFVDIAEQFDAAWEATPDRDWVEQIEPEIENVRAALGWSFGTRGDVELGLRLAGAFRKGWWYLAPAEGMRWVKLAQERVGEGTASAVRAALDLSEGLLATMLNQYPETLAASERASELCRELADAPGIADAHCLMGLSLKKLGRIEEGETFLQLALALAQSLGARKSQAYALHHLANAYDDTGDVALARQFYDQALAAARHAGAERLAAIIAVNVAEMDFRAGDAAAALRMVREARASFRAFHDTRDVANARLNEAAYLVALRRFDDARASAREALATARDMQWSLGIVVTLQHLAGIGALRPGADARRAARILGYVDARVSELGPVREYTEQHGHDAAMKALRKILGAAERSNLMAEGSSWSEDQAVAEALLI